MEAELVAKVDAALRWRLAEQIGGQESAAVPPDKIPKTVSQLELFSLFARQGSLPWWADLTQPHLLEESLHYLLHHAPERLRRLLRELAGEENPLQRLIRHYDDRRLTALAALLAPALAAFPAPLPRILTAVCQHAEDLARLPPSGHEVPPGGEATAFAVHARQSQFNQRLDSRTGLQAQLRRHIWRSILQVAALSEEPYREPIPFCRAVLLQLAGVLRLPYTALLTGLRQVLPIAATGVHGQLRDIAGTLAEELTAPAAPSQREGAPATALPDLLEALADRLPDPALRALFPSLLSQRSLDEAKLAERNPGSSGHEHGRSRRSLDGAKLAQRNPGSSDHEHGRSLDEAKLAQRNPGSSDHEHGRSLDEAELAKRNPGSPDHEQNPRSLDEAKLAERNPGSPGHEQNLHSRRSLDEAKLAERNPGSSGHEHRLDHRKEEG